MHEKRQYNTKDPVGLLVRDTPGQPPGERANRSTRGWAHHPAQPHDAQPWTEKDIHRRGSPPRRLRAWATVRPISIVHEMHVKAVMACTLPNVSVVSGWTMPPTSRIEVPTQCPSDTGSILWARNRVSGNLKGRVRPVRNVNAKAAARLLDA